MQAVLALQAVTLTVFVVASLVTLLTSGQAPVEVAGFRMNMPHTVLLLVTAVLSAAATIRLRAARWWIAAQLLGFTLLFLIGSTETANLFLALDRADNLGHLGLAVIAAATGMVLAGPWLTGTRVPGRAQEPTKTHLRRGGHDQA